MDKAKLLERMRQKQGKTPKAEPAPIDSFHSAGAAVEYRCGHSRPIKSFTGQECPECRNKSKTANAQRRAQERKAKAPVEHGRLPHLSQYAKAYDAAAESWTATLTIFAMGGASKTFEAKASGSLDVEKKLDRMYREWVKKGGQA